jgi:hypothetical protein
MSDIPPLVRMVQRAQTHRMMEVLRDPFSHSPQEIRAITINAGGPHAARDAQDQWLIGFVQELVDYRAALGVPAPYLKRREAEALLAADTLVQGQIEAGMSMFASPADRAAHWSDPEDRALSMKWRTWVGQYQGATWRPGMLVLMDGPMEAGKSHAMCLMGEVALQAGWYAFFNLGNVQDTTGVHSERIKTVHTLSEFILAWAATPVGARVFLGLDEVEAFLRGGNTTAVRHWENLVWHFRKWGVMCTEIWHNSADAHRSLREAVGIGFLRMKKDGRSTLTVESRQEKREGEDVRVQVMNTRVTDLPALDFLEFDTHDSGTFEVDVDVPRLIAAMSGLQSEAERKELAGRLVREGTVLLHPVVPDSATTARDALQAAREAVLADPERYRNTRGSFDADLIRVEFRLSHRDAEALRKRLNQEEQAKEP